MPCPRPHQSPDLFNRVNDLCIVAYAYVCCLIFVQMLACCLPGQRVSVCFSAERHWSAGDQEKSSVAYCSKKNHNFANIGHKNMNDNNICRTNENHADI